MAVLEQKNLYICRWFYKNVSYLMPLSPADQEGLTGWGYPGNTQNVPGPPGGLSDCGLSPLIYSAASCQTNLQTPLSSRPSSSPWPVSAGLNNRLDFYHPFQKNSWFFSRRWKLVQKTGAETANLASRWRSTQLQEERPSAVKEEKDAVCSVRRNLETHLRGGDIWSGP